MLLTIIIELLISFEAFMNTINKKVDDNDKSKFVVLLSQNGDLVADAPLLIPISARQNRGSGFGLGRQKHDALKGEKCYNMGCSGRGVLFGRVLIASPTRPRASPRLASTLVRSLFLTNSFDRNRFHVNFVMDPERLNKFREGFPYRERSKPLILQMAPIKDRMQMKKVSEKS